VGKGLQRYKGNLWRESNGFCRYCKRKMKRTGKKVTQDYFTVDHVVSERDGGVTNYENLAACCLRCNNLKGHGTVEQLMDRLLKLGIKVD
jgi:5-methylcytosine-specific restriction endonuclease McrA